MLGYQLLYTNVEADRSPTRVRGFQVWLASEQLSANDRRFIARRIDDYLFPSSVKPDDQSFTRFCYFRLEGNRFAIGRTVPLLKRDKFGRGGLFHAHVVVLAEADFQKIFYDPFRIIDTFKFSERPEQFADWELGILPPVDLESLESGESRYEGISPDALARIADYVKNNDQRTLVLPIKPDLAIDRFRQIFRGLPVELRVLASFDTFSIGASLGQIPFQVVASGGSDLHNRWGFRRFSVLNLSEWVITPSVQDPQPRLPFAVLRTPEWLLLNESDREITWSVAKLLAERTASATDEFIEAAKRSSVVKAISNCPDAEKALREIGIERIRKLLPSELRDLPCLKEFQAAWTSGRVEEALQKIAGSDPLSEIADVLITELTTEEATRPTPDALRGLSSLLKEHAKKTFRGSTVLRLILSRWQERPKDFERIREVLCNLKKDSLKNKLRSWILSTLPRLFSEGSEKIAKKFETTELPSREQMQELRLFLTLDWESDPKSEVLVYLEKYHSGKKEFVEWLRAHPPSGRDQSSLVEDVLRKSSPPQNMLGWLNEDNMVSSIGVAIEPADEDDRALFLSLGDGASWILLQRYITETDANVFLDPETKDGDPSIRGPGTFISKNTSVLGSSQGSIAPAEVAHSVDPEEAFRRSTNPDFKKKANRLLCKLEGKPYCKTDSPRLFYGLKIHEIDSASQSLPTLEPLLNSIFPPLDLAEPIADLGITEEQKQRFQWLVRRLENSTQTKALDFLE